MVKFRNKVMGLFANLCRKCGWYELHEKALAALDDSVFIPVVGFLGGLGTCRTAWPGSVWWIDVRWRLPMCRGDFLLDRTS